VERYNRILAEEFLYAHVWLSEAQRRESLGVWNIHYNYHRPRSRRSASGIPAPLWRNQRPGLLQLAP
jgi:hypothetical protein